jgi:hypothetical protein
LDFLRANRGFKSLSDIHAALDIDLEQRTDVLPSLKLHKNILVGEDARSIRYKPEYDHIHNINDLKRFIREDVVGGVQERSLEDAYIGIMKDLHLLEVEKFIYKIDDRESKLTIVYFRDRSLENDIDEDIKELWMKVEMPTDETKIEEALKRGGIMDDQQSTEVFGRKVKHVAAHKSAKSKRSEGKRKYVVSNTHMADELKFLGENGKIRPPK